MVRQKLADNLQRAVQNAQNAGEIAFTTLPEIIIERPQTAGHGDYASGLALRLARSVRMSPLRLAELLVSRLEALPEIESATIAAPGFINFTLKREWLVGLVSHILASPETYGNLDTGKRSRVQIEFVSANPTGPLHVGHRRGAVLG
ncbi:MAG: arginine--tRNA ligase, partial [Dehalococcoidia bacterium]|nr:arginine--tRNA ligase [Dehalococcoidia bacterium]